MENFTYVNRRFLHVFVLLLLSLSGQAQQIAKSLTASNGTFIGFLEYKPKDYNPTSTKKYPLIIFLHGIGERGNGTTEISRVTAQGVPKNIAKGHNMTFTFNGKTETFLVLSPQLDSKYGSWQQFYTDEMLKYAKANLNIDTNRIILTGLSLGGGGTWNYASASETKARQFAAIAPICGTCSMTNGCNIAKANLPVWTEHAQNDPTVSVNCTINANKAINACNPGIRPIEFLPLTGGHSIWTKSYDTTYLYHQPNIYEWFLGQNKSLAPNKLPLAVASAPAEVAITTASATLNGSSSSDPDGTIVRYVWRQISGPVATSIISKGSVTTNVTGITALGTYSYELTVVDNRANWSIDTVVITGVNAPVVTPNKAPVANAGNDQTITLPTNLVNLGASGSTDADGTIASYSWTKISGPASGSFSAASSVSTNFGSLTEGTYLVQLKVTDNNGATDTDTMQVIVKPLPNKAPVANAGNDQTITLPANTVSLEASASSDPDGSIVSYNWTKISGPSAGALSSSTSALTSFNSLVEGTYSVQLKVTDNDGASSYDTLQVIVKPAPNKAPVANAGNDQTITLPTNSVNLSASGSTDADGTIASYSWTKISGPASGSFSAASSVSTNFGSLTEGTYLVQLKVTDNNGATDTDTMQVTVKPAPNKTPVANAGNDQTITLPANTVSLDASASSDPDGSIVSYNWTKISGPSAGALSSSTSAVTSFNSLIEGTYSVQLKVTDNDGASSYDTLQVTVKPAPNKAPVANAGNDQTITLPINSVNLSAAGSTDADGTIASYAWTKISGPASGSFSAASSVSTNFGSLTEGTYLVQLKVTDNNGATDTDTMQVIVKPLPNKAPVANAGNDQTITLPANTVSLEASASSDPDGSIVSYNWTKISGPSTGALSSSTSAVTSFNSLVEGTYSVQLKVTDNDGASSYDTLQVTVKPAPNKAPVANAGNDQTITLPTNSVNLSASGSTDADGTISSYAWTKISGPASGSFSAASSVSTNYGALTEGTYLVQLKVTDNNGASDTDTMQIIVKPEPVVVVPNKAPTANAGTDQTITLPANTVSLDASASSDPDGSIVSYNWTKISGPSAGALSSSTSAVTSFNSLVEGTYSVQLKVTDNDGASSYDTLQVTVKPAPNKAPVANAGNDQTITLPLNSVNLSAAGSTDADGTIVSYAWTKISGPASGSFSAASSVSTNFGSLTEGTYLVQLKVTDNNGATDTDTMQVTVKPLPNKAPVANAGNDQTITLPVNTVSMDASASSDPDGSIVSYNWTKISGPSAGALSSSTSAVTSFNSLVEGTYSVQLKVTDNDGSSSYDTLQVIVKPAPNKAPVANAGNDQQVLTITEKVELDGSLSSDPDGTIVSYNWSRISGSGTMTMTQQDQTVALVYGLTEGTHVFRLTVKDNKGATDFDEVTIVVAKPANQKPVADAGNDTTLYYPQNKISLNGKKSKDNDGTIINYEWKQIEGTSTAIISSKDQVQTDVSEMAPGTFKFELSVTDNAGGISRDTVTVLVINNLKYEEKIQTHPNPANNFVKIKIQSDINGKCRILIRDCFGRVLKHLTSEKTANIQIENVDITSLKKGLYYIEYSINNSKTMVTRFIKH